MIGFHIGAWRVWYFLLPPPHQLWGHKGRLELGHLPGWFYSSLFPFPHPSQWMTIDRHSDHKDDRCRRRGNTSRSATCSSREDRHSLSQNRFDCIECTGLMKIMKKKRVIWSRWWWWWQVPGFSSIISENAMPSDAWKVCWRPFGSVNNSTSLSSTSTTMINYSLKRWSGFSPPGNTSGKLETKSWPFHSGRVNFFQNQQPMKPGSNSNHYDHDRWPRWPTPGEAWAAVHCGRREDDYRGRRLCKDW